MGGEASEGRKRRKQRKREEWTEGQRKHVMKNGRQVGDKREGKRKREVVKKKKKWMI